MSGRALTFLSPLATVGTPLTVRSAAALDQERRILAALGLEKAPLPPVTTSGLWNYYSYLAGALALPFAARCPLESPGSIVAVIAEVQVIGLLPPEERLPLHDFGLHCRAALGERSLEVPLIDLEVGPAHPSAPLIEDYWYWFWNARFDPSI